MTAQQAPLGEKTMAVLMAMLVALMPFSVDAYLPAIPKWRVVGFGHPPH